MISENTRPQGQKAASIPTEAQSPQQKPPRRPSGGARSLALGTLAIATLVASMFWLDQHYPLRGWLAWTLATIWGWQILLAVSLLTCGHALLVRLFRIQCASGLELVALAVPVGAVTFAMGIFVAGFLGLLGPVFAVVWPMLMLVLSLWSTQDLNENSLPRLLSRSWPARPLGPIGLAATLLGLLAVGLAYLQNFSPDSITYDAGWTHLNIAQDYAREGRIVPFLADWPKNLPHLGSVINTWSFLVPGLDVPGAKYMMALHTEFAFFLWTLVGVSAGIGRLGGRGTGAWSALFLFPAVFVYDHSLGGGADHFLAFFAVPVFLAVFETVQALDIRWWALLAVVMAGAVLTKFQAILIVVPSMVVLAIAVVLDLIRRRRRGRSIRAARLWRGPALAAGLAFLLTAPHFVKNLIFYRNPIFPFGQRLFTGSRPTLPDAALLADYILKHWGMHPRTAPLLWLEFLFNAVTTFPCHPHVPESGALFGASLLLVPWVPQARRLGFALLFCCGTLLTWNLTYVQGRNLQAVLPLLAVATGATLMRAYRVGWFAKVGISALVVFQVVAGFDSFFANPDRIAHALSLIRSAREGHVKKRFDEYQRDYLAIGKSLPKEAVVLMHNDHPNLGIDRTVLHDWLGFQSLIDHRTFKTVHDFYARLKELGVTHIVYQPGIHPAETRQSEAIFAAFAARQRGQTKEFGQLRVIPMPAESPPAESPYEVLLSDISEYPDGLYAVTDLAEHEDLPREMHHRKPPVAVLTSEVQEALLGRAQVVLFGRNSSLDQGGRDLLAKQFESFVSYGGFEVFVRRH